MSNSHSHATIVLHPESVPMQTFCMQRNISNAGGNWLMLTEYSTAVINQINVIRAARSFYVYKDIF